ncbi:MAG: alpha-L-fucosidase [Bacteroidales bacterium]|nr:MAG: alpha-L-fucosidase [Bacteroidales bacterium]
MKKVQFLLVLILITIGSVIAQVTDKDEHRASVALKHGAHRLGRRTDADMETWRNYGLGQFIHWGLYAIPGGHWKGKYYPGAAEWIRSWNDMPKEDYDNLYKQFDPKNFNPTAWAKQAKDMGVKYMIITTKHHDGFCLWPSKYTSYTIANTPYKKDIIKPLVDAYNAVGIDVYLYFSIIDWNHQGYRASIQNQKDSVAYKSFKVFVRNQMKELVTMYPTTKGFWMDGTWDKAWIDQAEFVDDLDKELRAMSPGLIIGSRFRADENGKRHFDTNGDLIGDYEQGWERNIPENIEVLKGNDWDCVMTIPENQWGYHSDWRGYVKTSYELIEMLVKCRALDGNFVLNFGPDSQGNIRPEETRVGQEIGDWMKENSEAIYGCKYSELKKPDWGYYTQKGNNLYLIIFNKPINNVLRVTLPRSYNRKPVKAYFLAGQKPLGLTRVIPGLNKETNKYFDVTLPSGYAPDKPFVIVLELQDSKSENDSNQPSKI